MDSILEESLQGRVNPVGDLLPSWGREGQWVWEGEDGV